MVCNNLKDVLANQVNMTISQDPALGSSLKIKGLSGNNVKILIDRVPVIGKEDPDIFYLIKDQRGEYYKLKFTGYYSASGARGYPSFQVFKLSK